MEVIVIADYGLSGALPGHNLALEIAMLHNDRIIVGIDVGTHKICTIVAEAAPGTANRVNVLGVGAVASEGVAKGMITDIVAASGAIEHSLEAAERQSGCRILSAYVSVSGNHVSSQNNRGLVAVSNPDRIITREDLHRAVEAASAVALPAERDLLHVVPRSFTVDGQEGIRNPVGLSGFRLDVEAHLVMGASNVRENLIRCVQKADVEVDDLVLGPLASAEAVLTEQEKNLGVVLVDIGHGTTDIAIYIEGSLWHTKVVPVGGWQLTNDLAIVFNIPYEAAEPLKLQHGRAIVQGSTLNEQPVSHHLNGNSHSAGPSGHVEEMLETYTFEGATRLLPRSELNEVMAARLDQIFGLVADEIRKSGYEGLLPAGLVLTGGVAALPGIDSLASYRLRMPVRVGRPQRIGGLAESFDSPAYATSAGLTLWGLKQSEQPASAYLPRPTQSNNRQEAKTALAKWLKGFLPQG